MYMIFFVLDNPDLLDQVLTAWTEVNVNGVTIIESTGLNRHTAHQHIPMRYLFGSDAPGENGNITLFAVVAGASDVQACLDAAERITGGLGKPNTGIFAAWPLAITKGVSKTSLT
jgi:nitrogen regulatory protein P-II 1